MQCPACGRPIFSQGLRACPDCQASLAGLDASDPAYARELAPPAPRPREAPPPVEPAGMANPFAVGELPRIPKRWLKVGLALLSLALLAPLAEAGLDWAGPSRSRYRAEAAAR